MDRNRDENSPSNKNHEVAREEDFEYEGRYNYEMDIDRMVNEGLGGGYVTKQNGLIEETTTDEM